MAKIIDVRGSGGQLVVIGGALALPTANTTVFTANVPIVAGSIRFNPDLNRVEYIGVEAEVWSDIAGVTSVNNQTTTLYTITTQNASGYIRCTNSSPVSVLLPENSSVPFSIGTQIRVAQVGTGQVTINAAVGVTINTPTTRKTRVRYSSVVLIKVDTNEWDICGDLATS
jgi:hypothetical protein